MVTQEEGERIEWINGDKHVHSIRDGVPHTDIHSYRIAAPMELARRYQARGEFPPELFGRGAIDTFNLSEISNLSPAEMLEAVKQSTPSIERHADEERTRRTILQWHNLNGVEPDGLHIGLRRLWGANILRTMDWLSAKHIETGEPCFTAKPGQTMLVNFFDDAGFLKTHLHGGCAVTTIIYLSCDENAGGELQLGGKCSTCPDGADQPHFTVKPYPGLCVMMPGYMAHGVLPYHGDAPRVSLVFERRTAASRVIPETNARTRTLTPPEAR